MAEAYSGAPVSNKITVLTEKNSIAQQFLTELRDKTIQQDRLRFNRNLERLGNIMAYEISREMEYREVCTVTPLKETCTNVLATQPVVAGVLRAALPLQSGLAEFFDGADRAFVSAYRKYIDENTFDVVVEYMA
ncbi:MAG TPA: uracil phosphoribosyltransferase, partial [Bacteroidia bacterium]|nr:uracil phosphoribosyltransferase [Bacteroidia bacterium]